MNHTRNRIDWMAVLIWGGLGLAWFALVCWRIATWVANNPQFNH